MNFLKLFRSMAQGQEKPVSQERPCAPAKPRAAQKPAPGPQQPTALGDPALQEAPSPERERRKRFEALTPREREVYEHLVCGKKMKEIAALLGVSYATVNFHCKGLYKKLRINTRSQLFTQYVLLDDSHVKKAREEEG